MIYDFVFWAGLSVSAWTWAGYPATLRLVSLRKRPVTARTADAAGRGRAPFITIIVPVYNAEGALVRKLANCRDLDYPSDRLEVIVVSDGSTDGSSEVAQQVSSQYPGIRLIETDGRQGKSVAQNLAASAAAGDVLLLTDVDSFLEPDALRLVARLFRDEDVGCVTGHVVWGSSENPGRAQSENLYWRFEHATWRHEDALGTLACASGTCMAVRRALFREIDPRYGDDVVLPIDVLRQGARVAYEPALTALERPPGNAAAALRARARMTLRSLRGTMSRREAFGPLRHPALFVTIVSHKLLRWATPFLFLVVLGSAIPLALGGHAAARWVLLLQGALLTAAGLGHLAHRLGVRIPLAGAAYDLALENAGMLIGVSRALLGQREIAYRPGGE